MAWKYDSIKNILSHAGVVEPAASILADGAGIGHLVPQPRAEEPPVGHVDLDFPDKLAFAADTKQIADEQHLEEHDRINGWESVVSPGQLIAALMDEGEINNLGDLTKR